MTVKDKMLSLAVFFFGDYYPVTLGFVGLVIARRPKADAAISQPSKVEAVPEPKCLTMMSTVSIVTGYYWDPQEEKEWVYKPSSVPRTRNSSFW
jgi:hypothetical protein